MDEQRRKQLDDIVKKMDGNGASSGEIKAVVNDFRGKYDVGGETPKEPASNVDTFLGRFIPTSIAGNLVDEFKNLDLTDPSSIPFTIPHAIKSTAGAVTSVLGKSGDFAKRGLESYKQAFEPGLDLDTRGQLVTEGGGRLAQSALNLIPGVNPDTWEGALAGESGRMGEAVADIANLALPKAIEHAPAAGRFVGRVAGNPLVQAGVAGGLTHYLTGSPLYGAEVSGAALALRPLLRASLREGLSGLPKAFRGARGKAAANSVKPKVIPPTKVLKPEFQPTSESLFPRAGDVRLENLIDEMTRGSALEELPRLSASPEGGLISRPRLGGKAKPSDVFQGNPRAAGERAGLPTDIENLPQEDFNIPLEGLGFSPEKALPAPRNPNFLVQSGPSARTSAPLESQFKNQSLENAIQAASDSLETPPELQQLLSSLEAPPEGHARLYRGEGQRQKPSGTWYTTDPGEAGSYAPGERLKFLDLPETELEKINQALGRDPSVRGEFDLSGHPILKRSKKVRK